MSGERGNNSSRSAGRRLSLTEIVALIVDHAFCLRCLAAAAGMPVDELERGLAKVHPLVMVRREAGRCPGCGLTTDVLLIDRSASGTTT